MSEDDRMELIEGTDEDGNRLMLSVEKYFFYNGEEYVLLKSRDEAGEETPDPLKQTLYVMKVAVSENEDGEEIEDFVPVDEDLAQRLIPVIKANWKNPEGGR